ncbi:MAG TPA: YggT family protein [Actinomycetota bacterium]|nr:YggT family protein [Actinomycetota bacterium]
MMIAAENVVLDVLRWIVSIYTIILFVKVIVSWALMFGFRPPISGPVRWLLDLLDDVTEPVLRPLRRLIPPVRAGGIGLDVSIIVAFVILWVLQVALSR